MKIAIGSDAFGFKLKEVLKQHVQASGHAVVDVTEGEHVDFIESSQRVAQVVVANEADRGIVIDAYGSGSFMVASKYKHIV